MEEDNGDEEETEVNVDIVENNEIDELDGGGNDEEDEDEEEDKADNETTDGEEESGGGKSGGTPNAAGSHSSKSSRWDSGSRISIVEHIPQLSGTIY